MTFSHLDWKPCFGIVLSTDFHTSYHIFLGVVLIVVFLILNCSIELIKHRKFFDQLILKVSDLQINGR